MDEEKSRERLLVWKRLAGPDHVEDGVPGFLEKIRRAKEGPDGRSLVAEAMPKDSKDVVAVLVEQERGCILIAVPRPLEQLVQFVFGGSSRSEALSCDMDDLQEGERAIPERQSLSA